MNYLLSAPKLDPLNWETVKDALTILWQGLLAIFVVIIAIVSLFNFCIAKAEAAKARRKAAEQANAQNDGEDAPQN